MRAVPNAGSAAGPAPADVLLLRVAKGDEHAFAELYDLVAARVFGLARAVLRDQAHAEEVTQEAFVQIWRTAARFSPSVGSAMGWILAIAHRRAVDRVRSESSHSRRVERESTQRTAGPAALADAVVDDLDRVRVRNALNVLTPLQREAVEFAYFGGLTHHEISVLLGAPLGTVKTRIRDGLIRLRDELGEAS
jgi:RNA polymerase sigma-70 factor, ECF subfamily